MAIIIWIKMKEEGFMWSEVFVVVPCCTIFVKTKAPNLNYKGDVTFVTWIKG